MVKKIYGKIYRENFDNYVLMNDFGKMFYNDEDSQDSLDWFRFSKTIILYSGYSFDKYSSSEERRDLKKKSAAEFEKFFLKLNESIGMEFKGTKMDVVEEFYAKYDGQKELEFFRNEVNQSPMVEAPLQEIAGKTGRANTGQELNSNVQKSKEKFYSFVQGALDPKALGKVEQSELQTHKKLTLNSKVISKEDLDFDEINIEYPPYYNPKYAYVFKLSWLYASSYSIFWLYNTIISTASYTNLHMKMANNSFCSFSDEPDDSGYLPSIKYHFKQFLDFRTLCEIRSELINPSMNFGVLSEINKNDMIQIFLGHKHKNLCILLNNRCLRWISNSFFCSSEQFNEKFSQYEYIELLRAIEKYI
jgi:hypothetical protein